MKKVLPQSRLLKRLPRKALDALSALVILVIVLSLFFVTKLTYPQDNKSVNAGSFAIHKGSEKREAAALMFNVYEGFGSLLVRAVVAGIVMMWNYIGRKILVYKGE